MGEFAKTHYNNAITRDNLLSMLYPRLTLARELLAEDGVLFCSIDDRNQAYVKCLFDEVFGEENFVATISRVTKKGGNKGDYIKPKNDFILMYFKNKEFVSKEYYALEEKCEKIDKWLEEFFLGENRRFIKGEIPYRSKLESRTNQRYYIECPDKSLIIPPGNVFPEIKQDGAKVTPLSNDDKCWTWSVERYLQEKENNRFYFYETDKSPFLNQNGEKSKWGICKKIFQSEILDQQKIFLTTLIDNCENSQATREVDSLYLSFSYPKPVNLIKNLMKVSSQKDSIILDFFAGSGTTGHAVLALNKEDGGNRKFILCQLNEKTDTTPNGIAYDVTAKRLKRIMTGECYDGTKPEKWLEENEPYGGSLEVYDIDSVANFETTAGQTPFEVIDETLYGKEKFSTVKEKIEWVCSNFEKTQKYLEESDLNKGRGD
ncbi:MAG: site-specific DNA-methyltransferase [Acetobacter sp.]|nr:site-specific DNA-methyltransferase [Acetobacter sp.]